MKADIEYYRYCFKRTPKSKLWPERDRIAVEAWLWAKEYHVSMLNKHEFENLYQKYIYYLTGN